MCAALNAKLLTTTEFHLQCNGQVKRYNRTLVARLCHYIDEHQQVLDVFVQPLTYLYSTQAHWTNGITPFRLRLSRKPPGSPRMTGCGGIPENCDRLTPIEVKSKLKSRLFGFLRRMESKSIQARHAYEKNIDKKVKYLKRCKPGNWVYKDNVLVMTRSQKPQMSKNISLIKLKHQKAEPYKASSSTENTVSVDI